MQNINFISLNPIIGGQEIYFINIINQLKHDYHIMVYTKLPVWEQTELKNIDGITLHDIGYIDYSKFLVLKKSILDSTSDHDIFIFNGNRAIYLGALFPKKYKKIAIQHSSLYDSQDGLLKQFLRTNFYRLILSKYNKLVGISKHSIEPLINNKKVEVILNGVDTEKFFQAPKPSYLMKKYSLKMNDKIILMVGVLNDNKGQYEALEILRYLDDTYKMVIVGEGEDHAKINHYIKKHKLSNRVYLVGKILNVVDYYHLADVLLFMSKYEGLPLTIIEAMACGVPVVTTNVGGISEIINDFETGLFISRENKKEIAAKVQKILTDKSLYQKIANNGFEIVQQRLNWEYHTAYLKQIIEEISL